MDNLIDEIRTTITNNLAKIQPYLIQNGISAYRLINNPTRLMPLTLDIYQDNAVIHVFSRISPDFLAELQEAVSKSLEVKEFFYKKNSTDDFSLPENPSRKIVLQEYGNQFLINLSDYLDTGLFLDQRETRRWVAGQSGQKRVLNTFAYTGSFTVYAARAGAQKTCSVDISRVYCAWIKENLKLNQLSEETNWVYKMDTLEFFRYASKKELIFDIVIIDPPTFSKNKSRSFSVQRDHPALINGAMEVLSPSGFVYFFN